MYEAEYRQGAVDHTPEAGGPDDQHPDSRIHEGGGKMGAEAVGVAQERLYRLGKNSDRKEDRRGTPCRIYCRSYYFRQQRFSGDESHDVQPVPVSTGKSRYCIPHCIGILVMRRDHDILL